MEMANKIEGKSLLGFLEKVFRGDPLCREKEPGLLVGRYTGCSLWKMVRGPQKLQTGHAIDPPVSLLGVYPRNANTTI